MTGLLDKLNLRPAERRLVVIVAIVVFVVINLLLVWPHFGDLGRAQQRKKDQEKRLRDYQAELQNVPKYEQDHDRLKKMGQYIAADAQVLELQREITTLAAASGVMTPTVNASPRSTTSTRTNYFEEANVNITFNSGEKELVEFLYKLSERGSLIRVKSMNMGRDPSQTRLAGQITFAKSYQKRPPPRTTTTAAPASASRAAATTTPATPARPPTQPPVTPASTPTPPAQAPPLTLSKPANAPMASGVNTNLAARSFRRPGASTNFSFVGTNTSRRTVGTPIVPK